MITTRAGPTLRPEVSRALEASSWITRNFPSGAVVVFDHELRVLSAGGLGLAQVGTSSARVEGRTVFDFLAPADVVAIEPRYRQALAGQESTFDLPYRDLVLLHRVVPLRDDNGLVVAGLDFIQDVTAERRSERALHESEERFRLAFEQASIGKALIGLDRHCEQVNQAMCEMTGYSQAQLQALTVADVTPPPDFPALDRALRQLETGELTTVSFETRLLAAATGTIWVAMSVSALRCPDGTPVQFLIQAQDITDRKEHEQVLADERRRLRAAQSIGRIGSYEMDVTTRVVTWSDTLPELYGLDPVTITGDYAVLARHIHTDDRQMVAAAIDACVKGGGPMQVRHRLFRGDNAEMRWLDASGAVVDDGRSMRLAGAVVDVTEQVLAEARLEHAALHDALTGLPNRRLVADRLGQILDRSERAGRVAVLFCDLDGFKRINDAYGHQVGDAVLMEIAGRLVGVGRSGDTVGRMGGDEFVLICGVPLDQDPTVVGIRVAERVERAMAKPFTVNGVEHRLTSSAGISVAGQGVDAHTVLRNAAVAMCLAKSRGKDGHAVFDAALHTDALDVDHTERQIRGALAADALEVHYQPIVEPNTGRVRGVEALLRVPDGAGGHLETSHVVAVAEQTGLISAVGDRVLDLACAQVRAWRRQPGHADLAVSVNRSAAEIARPGLYERITTIVRTTGLDPRALTIEITETALLEAAAHAITDLGRLRADGIGIAIDDFGTGYASLHYLATLPISSLKVDKSFTAGLPADPTCTTILRATVGLAADLGMSCIVEGVETVAQRDALPDSPRMLVQGFLYAAPQAPTTRLATYLAIRQPSAS